MDLTWVTPDMNGVVRKWEILTYETLLDHAHVYMEVGKPNYGNGGGAKKGPNKLRWNWKKANKDIFQASLILKSAVNTTLIEEASANEMEKFIRNNMRQSCNAAAPRTGLPPTKKQTYWWTDDVADLRRDAVALIGLRKAS